MVMSTHFDANMHRSHIDNGIRRLCPRADFLTRSSDILGIKAFCYPKWCFGRAEQFRDWMSHGANDRRMGIFLHRYAVRDEVDFRDKV